MDLAPIRTRTTDPEEAVPLLGAAFPTLRVSIGAVPSTRFEFEHRIAGDGRLTQQRIRSTASTTVAGDIDPVVAVGLVRPGDVWMRGAHGAVDVHRPFIHPLEGFTGGWELLDIDLVAFESAALRRLVVGLFGPDAPALAFTGTAPVDAATEQYWYTITGHITGVMNNPMLLTNPLIRGEAFRTAARALLLTFPNTVVRPTVRDQYIPARASIVDTAVAYIEARAADDIGLTGIAAAAGVTGTVLTRAFRQQLDRTPLQQLRDTRYRRAREDLIAGSTGSGTTVHDVALRWGFAHLGRFAVEYRKRYDESPSTTLAR